MSIPRVSPIIIVHPKRTALRSGLHGLASLWKSPFIMLRVSLRSSSSRLISGGYSGIYLPSSSGAKRAVATVSLRSKLPIASSWHSQKRCYAVAAEETDKGVVSRLDRFIITRLYMAEILLRIRTIHSCKETLPIISMKCICNGKKTLQAFIYHGRFTFEMSKKGACQYHKPFSLLQPLCLQPQGVYLKPCLALASLQVKDLMSPTI